jgi:hypothetical protein
MPSSKYIKFSSSDLNCIHEIRVQPETPSVPVENALLHYSVPTDKDKGNIFRQTMTASCTVPSS